MVLTDSGLNEMAQQFAGLISAAQWGESNTDPTVSDTGLVSATAATLLAVTSTSSGNSAQFTHEVGATLATGTTLQEYEVRFDDGTNLLRSLSGPITKTANYTLTTITTISFIRQ